MKADPILLEPIGLLKVTIPDANLGDIMADISSKRRGTVLGMNAEDGMQIVEAEVPMAEMSSYTIDLRSMTQGRGEFTFHFVRYEDAPANVQQKIVEEAKANAPMKQLSLFDDPQEMAQRDAEEEREERRQKAVLAIKNRFGANAIMKGTSYQDAATGIERNKTVGGHHE